VGQLADYALEFELGMAPLLIREFTDRYEVFLAGVQLTDQLIRWAEKNPSAAVCVSGALLGAVVGTAMTKSREGAWVGAGIGLLAAAILQAQLRRDRDSSLCRW
jgi:hypothetical protein